HRLGEFPAIDIAPAGAAPSGTIVQRPRCGGWKGRAMFKDFVINPPVFFGSVIIIAIFLAIGIVLPEQADSIFSAMQSEILSRFGWLYLLAVGIFLIAVLLMCLGRFGSLKLGPDDSTPDFRFVSWIAMLFAAGMGIGLMYYAVGEPMTHFA